MSYVKNITAHYRQMLDAIIEDRGDLARASAGNTAHYFVPSTEKTFHRGSTDYFVNARKIDIGAFDTPTFVGLPVGDVLKVGKDHLDVETTEPLANGDGLNVMIKREVVGFRVNVAEKTGENRYRVFPNEMPEALKTLRPPHRLNRNLDHNWQQALLKTSSERRVGVDIELGGWQEQLILTVTSEDGVSVTRTLEGQFDVANNAEKAMANLKEGLAKLGQTIYYARNITVSLPGALFVPNSLLNPLRREAMDALDDARLANYQRGRRKPVSVPPPVYPETHLTFLSNVYNQKARDFYQRYGVQLIDAAYEAHEEKGDVPVMITKHCLRFAFNLCPKQAKGNIKSWKATPMQLVHGDEVLTLKFDCKPCEMHVVGKIKNHILKMPQPGSVVASISPDELLKTLPKRKNA
jgi:putative protease